MIFRKKIVFSEKMYDIPKKYIIFRKKDMIFRKNICFSENCYDLTKFFMRFRTIILTVSDMILC